MPKEIDKTVNINRMPINHALQHVIWKRPVAEGESIDNDYYRGNGEVEDPLRGSNSGSQIRYILIGHHIIDNHFTNIRNLATSLSSGISNFSQYAFTRIKTKSNVLIYDKLVYNNLMDFSEAMINDANYQEMYYVEHYIVIDKTIKTPTIKGRNLAYWHLVGKSNYKKKNGGVLIGLKDKSKQSNGKMSILSSLSQFLSGQDPIISNNGGISHWDLGSILRPSKPESLHKWPFRGVGDWAEFLRSGSPDHGIYDVGNAAVRSVFDYTQDYGMINEPLYCSKIWLIDFYFDNEFNDISTSGYILWKNEDIRPEHGSSNRRSGDHLSQIKGSYFKRKEMEKKSGGVIEMVSSSLVLIEWATSGDTIRSYSVKPVSDDIYSIKDTSEAYYTDSIFALVEDSNKNIKIEKYPINRKIWGDIFNSGVNVEDRNRGFIGSFYYHDLIHNYLKTSSSKYWNRNKKLITEDIKISFLLADVNHSDGGYFYEPSDSKIILDKQKDQITEIIIKT